MLLRIGLIYTLSVLSFVLTGFVLWQGLALKASGGSYDALAAKYERLAKEHEVLRVKEQAADRRARVAEDSLSRAGTLSKDEEVTLRAAETDLVAVRAEKAALEDARTGLERAMKTALQERDASAAETAALRGKLDAALKNEKEARDAADRAAGDLKSLQSRAPPVPVATEPQPRAPAAEAPVADAPADGPVPADVPNAQVVAPAKNRIETVKAPKVAPGAPIEGWGVKVVSPPTVKINTGTKKIAPAQGAPVQGAPMQGNATPPTSGAPAVPAGGATNNTPATGEEVKAKIDPTSAPEAAASEGQAAVGQPAETQAAAKPAKPARPSARARPKRETSNPLEGFFPF